MLRSTESLDNQRQGALQTAGIHTYTVIAALANLSRFHFTTLQFFLIIGNLM